MKEVIVLGSGGHARAVIATIEENKDLYIAAVLDNNESRIGCSIKGHIICGNDSELDGLINKGITHAIIGIGSVKSNNHRIIIFRNLKEKGLFIPVLCHRSSILSGEVTLREGVQLMAGTILQENVLISENTIINTGTIVEHDTKIGAHCHIAPGVTIGGEVDISDGVFVGIGSTIKNGIKVGKNAIVGAGSVVISDVRENSIVAGVPAKQINVNE